VQQQSNDLGLRPLGIGELADKSVTLLVKHAVPLALIWLICKIPGMLLTVWGAGLFNADVLLFAKLVDGLGRSIAVLSTAAFIGTIYANQGARWVSALGTGLSKLPNAILLNIMLFLVAIIPVGVLYLILRGIVTGLSQAPVLAIAAAALPALAFLVAAALLYFIQYLALADMSVAERAAPEALGKAFGYIFHKNRFWPSLGLALALIITVYGGGAAAGAAGGFLMVKVNFAFGQAVAAILVSIAGAIGAVLAAVFYLDLRMRYDGYDLEQSLDALEQPATT
jgi:hypothetical protein